MQIKKGKPKKEIKLKEENIHPIEKKGRVFIEKNSPLQMKKVKEWIIYLWRDGDKYFAAAKIGGNVYGQGWEIEKDLINKESEARRFWQARKNAIVPVENTLNVLEMYGSKVTDSQGNIEWDCVQHQERLHSWFGALRKPRKFPIVEITSKEAFQFKLI